MISIYNHNLEDSVNCSKSGSTSPLWLSPVLDRRVRKQSAEYQQKIIKSASGHEITQEENFVKEIATEDETICDVSIEEIKSDDKVVVEMPIVVKEAFQISTGAIPKRPKIQVKVSLDPDVVHMRDGTTKPKTPLTERALKIRQAKEAFFKAPNTSTSSSNEHENYRLSQISIGSMSTISNSTENFCSSTSVLPTNNESIEIASIDSSSKTSSLPRNITNSDDGQESSKSSKFGLSSIATKLRKVKLKKPGKEVQKMNTIPVLCRQSLNVDFISDSSEQNQAKPEKSQSAFRFKKVKDENVKKSKSMGLL